jgi:hypothetical protein
LAGHLPAPKETFVHLFFDCAVVNSLISRIWETYIQELEINKTIYFLANYSDNESYNRSLGLFLDVFRFHLWQAKLEKKIPTTQKIITEIQYSLQTILRVGCKKLENFIDCPIFQTGRDERQREHNRP